MSLPPDGDKPRPRAGESEASAAEGGAAEEPAAGEGEWPVDEPDLGDPIEKLRHQEVVVRAGGITYRGILLGADEDEVYLKTRLRHVSVPMDRITQLVAADVEERFSKLKQIDPSFYQVDDQAEADGAAELGVDAAGAPGPDEPDEGSTG